MIQAYRQPKNLPRTLSNSRFITDNTTIKAGLYKCNGARCDICKFYIKEETSFITSNGTNWEMKCFANCNSKNVIYFLVCNYCHITSYIGKTDKLRSCHNNHISVCRHGNGSDKFDKSKNIQPITTIVSHT